MEKVRGHSGERAEFWLRYETNLTGVQCKMLIFPKEKKGATYGADYEDLAICFAALSLQKYVTNGD